jgi:FAD/FMN-containing dehydrogenase
MKRPKYGISRRGLLSAGLASTGSIILSDAPLAAAAEQRSAAKVDPGTLKSNFGFRGNVLHTSESGFEEAAFGNLWNELRPKRHPQIVAQAMDKQDVAAAVKFAQANKLKVTVRGGGHNWCNPSLRNGGLLIDLSNLNRVVSIDAASQRAVVQPIISNRQIQAALNAHGLSFPSGHCPEVKLSGYLLSGGMSWNHGIWGPGVGSVEAIEIVDAKGQIITANATQNPDYFWAARGSGPGFFGVAVGYHLKLYPLPRAITSSAYYYPYDQLVPVARWLDQIASRLPRSVELSLFVVQAPSELSDKATTSNGKVVLVSGVMFADALDAAQSTLNLLDTYPSLDLCLSRSVAKQTGFPALFDASGALWPSHLRCKVDALFFNAPLADLCQTVKDHALAAPSPATVLMFAIYTGKNRPPATPSDAAFSVTGNLYGGPWTMWSAASGDAANISWHSKCMDLLKPHVAAHYIGETDFVGHPEFAKLSYKPAAWERLNNLRDQYDPERLFFDFKGGLRS